MTTSSNATATATLVTANDVAVVELDWCHACDGAGEIEHYHSTWSKTPFLVETCERCDGTGTVAADAIATAERATEAA